ncbi:multidrug effflux MFS transporter [Rhabdaerophilum sp. SD176]|uniref:multidrug effflux MFS transporter n=1 Tax=Rhabdaerophilum sp. SD176 TaxID=2983548 RepID=UPI0024DF8309|nr:multidrug effflux MFS transporter [Rhabdaerophilum sp. SD176]
MMQAGSRSFLILLVVLSMLGPLTLNIMSPSIPELADALGTSKDMAQLTLSSYLFGMALSQLLLGPFADRFGRRPVLLVALGTYVAASCVAALAPNVEVLVVARTIQSFGATAGLTLGRTIIRDLYDRSTAASMIGYVTMAMMIAPMVAPLIGAKIDVAYGWRAIMAYCAILGVLSLALASAKLTETRPASLVAATSRQVAERTFTLMFNGQYMAFWGASAFCSALFFAFIGTAPYLMIDVLGYSKTAYGYWFMTISVGYMVGNFISGRLSQKLGIDRLIAWGNVAGLAGTIGILIPAMLGILNPFVLFLPAMMISFGNGMVLPNAIAGGLSVDPKAAGAGSGLMGFGQVGVGAVVSFVAAKLGQNSALPLALMMLACAILAYLSGWASRHPDVSRKGASQNAP